jgi:hypothetical protein
MRDLLGSFREKNVARLIDVRPGPALVFRVSVLMAALGSAGAAAAGEPAARPGDEPSGDRPPPLHVEYAQYGVAFAVESVISPGATCPNPDTAPIKPKPCILGSGGGLTIRGGYRYPGPWYIGGAYEFTKMDSSNLYRLGIFQQLRAEMRFQPDVGYRASPYVQWGLGGVAYGNEWGIETGGGQLFAGVGIEIEVSRLAVVGIGIVYRPTLLASWKDTAGQERPLGVAQFLGVDLILEVRTVLGRR